MLFKGNKKKDDQPVKSKVHIHKVDDVVKARGADKYARQIGHIPLTKRTDVHELDLSEEEPEEALKIGRRK